MVRISDVVGEEALFVPENATEDLSAQIEATSGGTYKWWTRL